MTAGFSLRRSGSAVLVEVVLLALIVLFAAAHLVEGGMLHDGLEAAVGLALVGVSVALATARRGTRRTRTEHERAVRSLERSEERFRLAQSIASIGTWDGDPRSWGSEWSPGLRELYGVGPDDPSGFPELLALVHPEDRARVDRVVREATALGESFAVDFRIIRPVDGETRWVSSRGRAFLDENGVPDRVLGVVIDDSERRRAAEERTGLEQRLLQAERLESVGRLAGGVAHDFNNLLLGIRGYGELALRAIARGEQAGEEVTEMLDGVDRAALLTRQLLAFSRRQVLEPETLDLNDVVAEMDKLLSRVIGEDVQLETLRDEEPVYVHADHSQLEQVIANLAVNARDAMPEGGRLLVEVSRVEIAETQDVGLPPGRYALLAVSDTGAGMDSETMAQIFEPFFTTKMEGTGLGLATVHGIVSQSGGAIWVYSEVGDGTTFKVYLPLVAAPGAVAEAPVLPAAPAPGAGETIMLIEDAGQVREIVRQMLVASGYHVLAAADGEHALRIAGGYPARIDLLLTDLVMPGMSGRAVADSLRRLQPGISVLYMSGYTDDAVVRRGVLARGTAFLQKPFSSQELAARVRELLDARAAA